MRGARGKSPIADDPTQSLAHTDDVPAAPEREPTEATVGETIGRYQVRRLLGAGGMGKVYLARDVVLGRSVALKLVGPSRGAGFATERFLHEARAIARLNHPHVVQLYDFGEYNGGLYLALEYVEGETLRERARLGALGLDEILRHARAIADGLAHAHAAGVYHCDLKPSNVMLGKDGRVRVVDFGIARTGENAAATGSGSPDWMAPEQWTAAPLTDRVDSWALGIVIAELLAGRHPLGDNTEQRRDAARDPARMPDWTTERSDVPPAIVELVNRALEREPTLRPSAAEWARVLDRVIGEGKSDAVVEDGPYRGLAAFDEKHARFYFGRELEIDAFLERLRDTPHLPIVGPSGAGKSSFLHAGVIPRLRAREAWTVIAFRPGNDPTGALARHVIMALGNDRQRPAEAQLKAQVHAFRGELLETPTLLAARLATIAHMRGSHVLLAVDQLEEAFTHGSPESERRLFLQMLLSAVDDPLDPVRLVVTVRDDFVGKLPGLRSLFVIKKLGVDDIRRTITGPLARYDYQFDDAAIVDDLIAEVGSAEAGNLPLLQFACRTLWDGRDAAKRRLLRSTYRAMGGLTGALARHADHALTEMSPDEIRTARLLLLQLVVGTTRRSVPRDQLVATAPSADAVLDRLLAARLLVQRQTDGETPIIELVHESLVQTWSQLARWLDESREERRLLEELDDAARLWERRGKRAEDTWAADDLSTARHRATQLDLPLPPRIQDFIDAGERHHGAIRRQRRRRIALALTAVAALAVPAAFAVGRYVSREQLLAHNTGTVDLVLIPFDVVQGMPVPSGVGPVSGMSLSLYAAKPDDLNEPGEPLPVSTIDIGAPTDLGMLRTQRIRAPGGTAFLRFDNRGRPGEKCPPSWIRLQAFPGYLTENIRRLAMWVPTCQASLADAVTIDAGQFIYGGAGEPASRYYGKPDYTDAERFIDLPRFAMDRHEVSNAALAPFAKIAALTGYAAPIYPTYADGTIYAHTADPEYPVSSINSFAASAFCAYMGKRLPTDYQWVKAARGGLTVFGNLNTHPRRLYPWGTKMAPECVNIDGRDPYPFTAPVDSFACGASPYGILHLVGNAQEWIAHDQANEGRSPLDSLRGGTIEAPVELEQYSTIFRNGRRADSVAYGNGFRCAMAMPESP